MVSEKGIEALGGGRPTSTFTVFAEWLKDNRNALDRRLDAQDRKLEEIHRETRRTNGRVTDLERRTELASALEESKDEWETNLEARAGRSHDRRERRSMVRVGAAATVFGGLLGAMTEIGRSLGWW